MKNFTAFVFVLSVLAASSGQRITTIHLDGVQYFISRMNPYSPELNYFLAYQYCRSLGLQLASFETKEKAESMTTYLKNAGYGGYNFWTSGNRLGTKMFLWMSTGLPFNATFDFFENSDEIQEGILDPIDHNSNTSPQRTARDSGAKEKACVILQTPTLKWVPEDCFAIKDFICEQTRCYYYNYGSIPVSSAQGRPIASTTVRPTVKKNPLNSHPTTPLPHTPFTRLYTHQEKIATTTTTTIQPPAAKMQEESRLEYIDEAETNVDDERPFEKATVSDDNDGDDESELDSSAQLHERKELDAAIVSQVSEESAFFDRDPEAAASRLQARGNIVIPANNTQLLGSASEEAPESQNMSQAAEIHDEYGEDPKQVPTNSLPVEVRLKQISQEIEQTKGKENNLYYQKNDPNSNDDIGRQSFLSLTDLIRTLRPSEKHVIIDSDYSNAMRVLGDNSMVNNNELRKLKNLDDTAHLSESSSFGL